jgi:hypothetical protein
MWYYEIETQIASRDVTLLGHMSITGDITVTDIYDYTNDPNGPPMPSAEREAFVAEHWGEIDDTVRDHAQAEDERRAEERNSGPRARF